MKMPTTTYQPELVAAPGMHVGEGPLWIAEAPGHLLWVDHEGEIRRFDPARGEERALLRTEGQVASIRRRRSGGYVVALETTFHAFDGEHLDDEPLAVVDRSVPRLLNDTAVDAVGSLWAGLYDPAFGAGTGELLRVDADGGVHVAATGFALPNGIGFSQSGDTLYLTDSFAYEVLAFDFDVDRGTVGERRVLWGARNSGYPDGLAVDTDGNLWIAFWDGWVVRCIAPDGRLIREVQFPVAQTSSCAFGGPGLDELYVTSARYELSTEALAKQPHAGGLFRMCTDVVGSATFAFAG